VELTFSADASALEAFARERARRFVVALVPGALVAAAILAMEYRAMLIGIVALAPALIAAVEAGRARQACKRRFVAVRVGDEGVEVRDAQSALSGPATQFAARITGRFAVLARTQREGGVRTWNLPIEAASLRALGHGLSARGARLVYEREASELILVILGGTLAWLLLRVLAASLVLGALAQFGLALFGAGGSSGQGAAMLAGGLAALTAGALARRLVARSRRRSRGRMDTKRQIGAGRRGGLKTLATSSARQCVAGQSGP
jgi:hypothetical protein